MTIRHVLCAVLMLQTADFPRSAPAAPQAAETEVIDARDGTRVAMELMRIDVPENRNDPDTRTITLAYVRVRSVAGDPGPPVFLIAGGPGGSSIDMVRGMVTNGGHRFLDLLGGDVIGIDQRGVGLSRPNLESPTLYGWDPAEPGDPERMLAQIRRVCSEEAARWRAQGVDLDGYTTAESADDIDAVRRALGYPKIALWGGSYGAHLALATIRRHGRHIDRAMLTGPEGPDHTIKLPSYAQEGLARLGALVAADPELGGRIPDLVGTLRTVLARLEAVPVSIDVDGTPVGISKFDVQNIIANDIATIRGSGAAVPAIVWRMAQGDFEPIARRLLEERRESGIGTAMQMVMDSASGVSAERAARIAAEAPACVLADTIDFPFPKIADAWGVPDLGDAYRAPLHTDIPVLFIVGELDSRTPVSNARELMQTMPNAHLIVVTNVGHNDVPMGHPELLPAWRGFFAGRQPTVTRIEAPSIRFDPIESD